MNTDISAIDKKGNYIEVAIKGELSHRYVAWDKNWGGRGGFFTPKGKAIAEKDIVGWKAVSFIMQHNLKLQSAVSA